MKLILPWPPSVNSLYCQGPTHGQKFLTKKGRDYKKALCNLYSNDKLDAIDYKITVTIGLFPPDSRTRDIDNYLKPLLDGLKWLEIIEDDHYIYQVLVEKGPPIKTMNKGCVVIKIEPYIYPAEISISYLEKEIAKLTADFDQECMQEFHKPTKKELKKNASDKEET